MQGPPVIIPLGRGSARGDCELRYLLRSIDRHLKGHGGIYLVTDRCPGFINRNTVNVVKAGDAHADNKDANLHDKVLAVLRGYDVDDFIFAADDNVVMQDVDAAMLPVLHQTRTSDTCGEATSRWGRRLAHTLDWAASRGAAVSHPLECHAPQLFHGRAILEGMDAVDYASQPGLTIYTTWRVLDGTWRDAVPLEGYKTTLENRDATRLMDMTDADLKARMFLGYNDGAVACGMLDRLARLFPSRSIYER